MKEIYIVATLDDAPVDFAALEEELESDAVAFTGGDDGWSFRMMSAEGPIDVRFEARTEALGETPDLLTGSPAALAVLRSAKGFYRIGFETEKAQPPLIIVEALVIARLLLERSEGALLDVSAFKVHGGQDVEEIVDLDFDIRDHLNIHVQQLDDGPTPLWVHTHGMEKFGARDVEFFHLAEADLQAAESFLYELCADIAMGQGPTAGDVVGTSEGNAFRMEPSETARTRLLGVPLSAFDGHEGPFLTIVSPDGRHTAGEVLRPYRDRFDDEPPARTEALQAMATRLLPAFKQRFMRRGLMEPLTFLVRASFETHPEDSPVGEDLWAEILSWDEDPSLVGRLIDGSSRTTEWRKGAIVEIAEDQINALIVTRDGAPLDEAELRGLLDAERPS